jgi:hypothetical protein
VTLSEVRAKPILARTSRVIHVIADRPGVDWGVAVTVGGLVWFAGATGVALLPQLEAVGRRSFYQTIAGLSGTLFGLSVTSAGLLMANLNAPLSGFPGGLPFKTVVVLGRSLFSLIRALGYICLASLFFMLADTSKTAGDLRSRWLLSALLILVILRFSRVLYWIRAILRGRATAQL